MKKELKPGSKYCDKCNGLGNLGYIEFTEKLTYIYKDYDDMIKRCKSSFRVEPLLCDKCNGVGELDWIEEIVGKRK